MKLCTSYFLLFRIFAYTISSSLNSPKEDNADLALKVVLELNVNEKSKNEATNETDTDDHKTPQPDFKAPRVETFKAFIQEVANILNTYDDIAFADFFDILDEEIRKYHYRGCKFYELTENYEFRNLMAEELDMIKSKSVPVLKADINKVADILRHETYDKNVKELLDYINSLYREDAREKFENVLTDLKAYDNSTSERPKNYLVKIIRDGVRAIIFNHYTDLNINVRRGLKKEITTFLKKNKEATSSSSNPNLFPYKIAVKESKNTVKIYGYNIATGDGNSKQIDPTSTANNNAIFILKASDEKHQEEATKLETSKEENNSQQLTYLSTDKSSDDTLEENSVERQQEFNSQPYATTEKSEIMYKSDLKSKLVQRMLVESAGRLMSEEELGRSIVPAMPEHGTTSNEDTQAEPDKLKNTIPSRINSRDVSDEDLRRSIPPPLPEEELSIDVFDREERKRQKFLAKSNRIATVPRGLKNYIKRMRKLQNKINQLKKIDAYNQNSRMNVISNGYIVKKFVDDYEAKKSKNRVRVPKRNVKKTNSVNEDGQESNIIKKYGTHTSKLINKKKPQEVTLRNQQNRKK